MRYFAEFPIIEYKLSPVRNIFARVKFDKKIEDAGTNFYPYQLEPGDRPDVVAYGYYDDSFSDWLIYFTNKIVDPYYDYYLDEEKFNAFIDQKYGGIANAQSQIYGYRNNWNEDDTVLTVSGYEALTKNLKKFWKPVVGYTGSITGYERTPHDTYLNTNMIVSINIDLSGNSSFTVGERATQYNGATPVANGVVTFSNTTNIIVKHVTGAFQANTSYTVKGDDSSANATATGVTVLKQNYANNEAIYYSSYSYYDYENELNSQKRIINLIDNRYSSTIERQFKALMNR
jgi:hypothetical protein